MTRVELYGRTGLDIYEKAHYARCEHIEEVRQIVSWLPEGGRRRVLDIGCSAGLHALEFVRRGYILTGIDLEPFAIARARGRSRRLGLSARFTVFDIARDDFSRLGEFDFIYSIGNVLSHIDKRELPGVMKRIASRLAPGGSLLLDLLIKGSPFRTRIKDDYHRILWQRTLDEATGRIAMNGYFTDFGLDQHFDVWGYSVGEARGIIESAGLVADGVSDRLDFSTAGTEESNPFCLNFRARALEGG